MSGGQEAARLGEEAARGLIAKAAKDVLRDAEPAAARSAARDASTDAAKSEEESVAGKLEMQSLRSDFRGENAGAHTPVGGDVHYLDDTEREALRLDVRDGKLVAADGAPFDTAMASSVHTGGGGRAIYVMDGQGNIYASTYQEVGVFHHSSLLAGGDVAGAGELVVRDGQLERISTRSGHYRPTAEMQKQVLEVLRGKGLDVSRVIEEGWF